MSKQLVIITRGLPASGKSTFAKAWVLENPKNRIRVNRDDIRRMIGPYWVPTREELVTAIEHSMIKSALDNHYSVVIDATNFKDGFNWISKSIWFNVEKVIQDFTDVPLEICIERDSKRGNESVGREVIEGMYNKYLKK